MIHIAKLLVAFLIGLALFVWTENFSSSFQSCVNQQAYNNGKESAKEKQTSIKIVIIPYLRCTGRFVNDHNGGISAIAAALIAAFTAIIWDINRSQLAHAHQVERAYLSGGGVLGTEIVASANGSVEVPVFELAINNHGKTPGRLLEIGSNVCESNAIPKNPDYQWRHSFDWIGPGTQSRRYGEVQIPTHLRNPIVYARLRYRDIFGDEHSCGFIQRGSQAIPAPAAYTDWD